MKIHRPQWSTTKPLIQWQWLDSKKPLKNHWYQWFKFDKIIDDNGWIVKILEKTIGYNGFFSKTINHSIVLKKWPLLWSSLGSHTVGFCVFLLFSLWNKLVTFEHDFSGAGLTLEPVLCLQACTRMWVYANFGYYIKYF